MYSYSYVCMYVQRDCDEDHPSIAISLYNTFFSFPLVFYIANIRKSYERVLSTF